MSSTTKKLGQAGEDFAAQFLERQGYKIIARNFSIRQNKTLAEIDIIAEREGEIVFVEVKTRSNVRHGLPVEAVDSRKQRRIIQAASVFLQDEKFADCACRFDVIEVYVVGRSFELRHIENAFEVSE